MNHHRLDSEIGEGKTGVAVKKYLNLLTRSGEASRSSQMSDKDLDALEECVSGYSDSAMESREHMALIVEQMGNRKLLPQEEQMLRDKFYDFAECVERGDVDSVLAKTHERARGRASTLVGGGAKSALSEAVRSSMERPGTSTVELTGLFGAGFCGELYRGGGEEVCFLGFRTTTENKNGEKSISAGCLAAVRRGGDNWTFVELTKNGERKFAELMPELRAPATVAKVCESISVKSWAPGFWERIIHVDPDLTNVPQPPSLDPGAAKTGNAPPPAVGNLMKIIGEISGVQEDVTPVSSDVRHSKTTENVHPRPGLPPAGNNPPETCRSEYENRIPLQSDTIYTGWRPWGDYGRRNSQGGK